MEKCLLTHWCNYLSWINICSQARVPSPLQHVPVPRSSDGYSYLCILALAATTFHSDIPHPFNICVFMWTSWLQSLRVLMLWHQLIVFCFCFFQFNHDITASFIYLFFCFLFICKWSYKINLKFQCYKWNLNLVCVTSVYCPTSIQ